MVALLLGMPEVELLRRHNVGVLEALVHALSQCVLERDLQTKL